MERAGIEITKFFPPRICKEIQRQGVALEFRRLENEWAHYDAARDCVVIDPDADVQTIAGHYSRLCGVEVSPEESLICVLFHELAHREDRENLGRIAKIQGDTFGQTILLIKDFRVRREIWATERAVRRFWDWRTCSIDRGDFARWKRARE